MEKSVPYAETNSKQKSIERTRYIIWVIWARWVDPPAPRMLGLQALGFFLPVVLNIVRMCVMGGR